MVMDAARRAGRSRHNVRVVTAGPGAWASSRSLSLLAQRDQQRRLAARRRRRPPAAPVPRPLPARQAGLRIAQPHACTRTRRSRHHAPARRRAADDVRRDRSASCPTRSRRLPLPCAWAEAYWAAVARDWPIGIVDATPVGHTIAPVGGAYGRRGGAGRRVCRRAPSTCAATRSARWRSTGERAAPRRGRRRVLPAPATRCSASGRAASARRARRGRRRARARPAPPDAAAVDRPARPRTLRAAAQPLRSTLDQPRGALRPLSLAAAPARLPVVGHMAPARRRPAPAAALVATRPRPQRRARRRRGPALGNRGAATSCCTAPTSSTPPSATTAGAPPRCAAPGAARLVLANSGGMERACSALGHARRPARTSPSPCQPTGARRRSSPSGTSSPASAMRTSSGRWRRCAPAARACATWSSATSEREALRLAAERRGIRVDLLGQLDHAAALSARRCARCSSCRVRPSGSPTSRRWRPACPRSAPAASPARRSRPSAAGCASSRPATRPASPTPIGALARRIPAAHAGGAARRRRVWLRSRGGTPGARRSAPIDDVAMTFAGRSCSSRTSCRPIACGASRSCTRARASSWPCSAGALATPPQASRTRACRTGASSSARCTRSPPGAFRAVVAGTAARRHCTAWLGARAGVPFVLWSALWRGCTPAHLATGLSRRPCPRRRCGRRLRPARRRVRPAPRRRRVTIAPQAVDNAFWSAPVAEPAQPAPPRPVRRGRPGDREGRARAGPRASAALPCARPALVLAAPRHAGCATGSRRRAARAGCRNFYAGADVVAIPSIPSRQVRGAMGARRQRGHEPALRRAPVAQRCAWEPPRADSCATRRPGYSARQRSGRAGRRSAAPARRPRGSADSSRRSRVPGGLRALPQGGGLSEALDGAGNSGC